ncbi:MAG: exo-alpha-sialidase [Caldilineaceae bacterium]|nr:exo-alpha-sialidase [Caldilineaceae bacterium]
MPHTPIFRAPGRYAGWPANYGLWAWDDEIVVGFTLGYYKADVQFHPRDKERPFQTMQARSVDGGASWTVAPIPCRTPGGRALSADEHMIPELGVGAALADDPPQPCPGDVDFTHPDFAVLCARSGLKAGARSWFYLSTDRCRSWQGPYALPDFGQTGIAARTDVIVLGPRRALFFLTAAKPDGEEGRVFCAETVDGGRTFAFRSWVTPEPAGYTIMPASVRLPSGRILTAVRCSATRETTTSPRCWIDLYVSDDEGQSWQHLSCPVADAGRGGNPPAMIVLRDGRLCLVNGYRNPPYEIHTRLSADDGHTWGAPTVLRSGGGNHDIGYPRIAQRKDGALVAVYYWNDDAEGERFVEVVIGDWDRV